MAATLKLVPLGYVCRYFSLEFQSLTRLPSFSITSNDFR